MVMKASRSSHHPPMYSIVEHENLSVVKMTNMGGATHTDEVRCVFGKRRQRGGGFIEMEIMVAVLVADRRSHCQEAVGGDYGLKRGGLGNVLRSIFPSSSSYRRTHAVLVMECRKPSTFLCRWP